MRNFEEIYLDERVISSTNYFVVNNDDDMQTMIV